MTTELSAGPSSSAAHGVTYAQNVAADVATRVAAIRRRTRTHLWIGIGSIGAFVAAVAGAWMSDMTAENIVTLLYYVLALPATAWLVYLTSVRAERRAEMLDRARDVSWVTRKDGLVFFSDEAFFVERGVGLVPFTRGRYDVDGAVDGGVLRLIDKRSVEERGRAYRVEMRVPDGWTDDDTARIRERLR
jgi:hypothetical protein